MRCKHEIISIREIISASHDRVFSGDEYYCNNEYGNRIKVEYECMNCNKTGVITHHNLSKQPMWLKNRIDILIRDDKWFMQ